MIADKDYMMTELAINRDRNTQAMIKWTAMFMFLTLSTWAIFYLHQTHSQKLQAESQLLHQKSYLVSKMHNQMLNISRTQLELLHASNQHEVKTKLSVLTTLVSEHLVHYYQLRNIADENDADMLRKFKAGFDKWQGFNESLLTYANVISDSGFINTLNKVDLAISQLDEDSDKALLLISQIQQSEDNIN